jgi:hypothetical protein
VEGVDEEADNGGAGDGACFWEGEWRAERLREGAKRGR